MFMTTANVLDTIQPALRDRMEVIRLSGYTEEEKLEIAMRHLLPKQIEENGVTSSDVQISKTALRPLFSSTHRKLDCDNWSGRSAESVARSRERLLKDTREPFEFP